MPTYEYECTNCGYRFDLFQKITDKPLDKCPRCQKKVKRLIGSGSGIIFKGSGFYATDYRKKPLSKRSADKSDTPSSTCPENKGRCNTCPNAG